MTDAFITIDHNPDCGRSRITLALIRNSGVEPLVIEYPKTPPGRTKLVGLIVSMGVPVRSALRQKGSLLANDDGEPVIGAVTLERSRRVAS